MTSPYRNRPRKSFWKTGVAAGARCPADLYSKRFTITPQCRIATAGSCFAQHIAAHLVRRRYNVIDVEPPPPGMSEDVAQLFGYRLYSARYGNIYTAKQLLQLAEESFGTFKPAEVVWSKNGRFFDALRPTVEPDGLDSPEEVLIHRARHLRRVREVFETADLLIFTLGLTETWMHRSSGTVYPTAPETVAGLYDPDVHAFKNFTYEEVVADLIALRALLQMHNKKLQLLLTVSPVPLAATASKEHVLVATVRSKAILRAAADAVYSRFEDVDYFPSFEIIATPFLRPSFYDSDLRTITRKGVDSVMQVFLNAHEGNVVSDERLVVTKGAAPRDVDDEVICEEALLEAFAQ